MGMIHSGPSDTIMTDTTSIRDGIDLYCNSRNNEISAETLRSHRSRLSIFAQFCDDEGIDAISSIDGQSLLSYKLSLQQRELAQSTINGYLTTLAVWIGFCASIDCCDDGLQDTIHELTGPVLATRSTHITSDEANTLLEYLSTYEYATPAHVIIRLFWVSGIRMGTLRSIDLEDITLSEQSLTVVHRPESETPLKNQSNGERVISLDTETARIINDYIRNIRHDVTDEHGREPLLTSKHGRLSETAVRHHVYQWTRPCEYTGDCPHDRSQSDCEAKQVNVHASMCPSTVSPHDIRRGAITNMLRHDTPPRVVSERSDVSESVLDKHYDQRNEREKMEIRRKYTDGLF